MVDELNGQVTASPNPDNEPVPGQQPSDPSDGRSGDDPSSAGEATHDNERDPDARYKGLQRVVASKDKRIADLEQQVAVSRQRGDTPQQMEMLKRTVAPFLQELAQTDPDRARALALNIAQQMKNAELEDYKAREQNTQEQNLIAEAERQNLDELRETARDLGADPDDDTIEYGDSSEYLSARIRRVRQQAREAAKEAAPTHRVKPRQDEGTAHNANPGRPAEPRVNANIPTEADWQAALHAYQTTPGPKTMARLKDVRERRRAALMSEQ